MYSAIYYPHMEIKNSAIIKTALLLWDELRYIAPSDDFGQYSTDADTQEALELIAKPLIPSDDDKRLAHNGILELVTSDLPNEFLLENCPEDSRYMIYPM